MKVSSAWLRVSVDMDGIHLPSRISYCTRLAIPMDVDSGHVGLDHGALLIGQDMSDLGADG